MRILAHPSEGDALVTAGASGACGLAGLLAITEDESFRLVREACGLNAQSRVLAINTEGATDPILYEQVIGRQKSAAPSAVFLKSRKKGVQV